MVYVALLRGINVGGNSRVEMAKLKITFASLGFQDVLTYINSGNVIFRDDSKNLKELVAKIEQAISIDFGINIKVIVRNIDNIQLINKSLPDSWVNNSTMKSDVMFLWADVDAPSILERLPNKPELETVQYVHGALLWNIDRQNITKSGMLKLVGTDLYKKMTVRNVNTTRRILEIMENL